MEITDIAADAALYLPFAFIAPFGGVQIALFIWLAAMTEFCGVLGQVHGNSRRYDGPFGKKATVHSLSVHWQYGMQSPAASIRLSILMWLACAALVYTCYKRVING